MFTTTQQISDQLKALCAAHPSTPAQRTAAANALTQLERLDFHPLAFTQALAESPFMLLDDTIHYEPSAVTIHTAVAQFVAHYRALVLPADDAPMDTHAAAAYLGVSERTIKHHVYETGLLSPAVIGTGKRKSLVFTRQMLDDFQASRRPAGRPALDVAPAVDTLQAVKSDLARLAHRIEGATPALAEDILDLVQRIRDGHYD